MGNNKFKGDLKQIDPSLLLSSSDKKDEVGSFFICLGVIYNDLKGISLFYDLLTNYYELPEKGEVSVHSGNYYGVVIHINKLFAGAIHEFFKFLNSNRKILENIEFKSILESMSTIDQDIWLNFFKASTNNLSNIADFLSSIKKIRCNIAFHYDQSGRILTRGYRSKFFKDPKDSSNNLAYYSIGNNIKLTRFYFSDAAAEKSLYYMISGNDGSAVDNKDSIDKYNENIYQSIMVVSSSISKFMSEFIKYRRKNPIEKRG